jgi:hypothetical protein
MEAAREAKSAKTEARDEDSEREADSVIPATAWLGDEESERDADNDAKRANTELRLEESEIDTDWTMPAA